MRMTTGDLYRLASIFLPNSAENACSYACRAMVSMEAEGAHDRAQLWFLILVLLGDIEAGRIDPDARISIH